MPDAASAAAPPAGDWWTPSAERAEVVEQPASNVSWRPVPRAMAGNTSAGWSLAFIPLIAFGISFAYQVLAPMFGFEARYSLGIGIAALIASYRVAKNDREELTSRGLSDPPHPAWVLLGVVTYLGIRYYRISRAGGVKASGPFWVALGSTIGQVALIAVTVLALLAVVAVQALAPTASDVSALLEDELMSAGYNVTVTCPEDGLYTAGSAFTCAVSDPNGAINAVDVTASSEGDQIYYEVTAAR